MVDDNAFFRGATLRICGALKIEQAMCACARYLRDVVPVDRMFL